MKAEKYLLTKWQFAMILLAGTVIRFMYGCWSQAWLAAPDQLAWQLGLDEMMDSKNLRYLQLVHAPHEGGSFLVGLLSLLFRPFSAVMPPLSIAALVIDTLSRAIQVKLAQKLFGDKTALLFGTWTILSVPLLIPWGAVNYGLHSLFSFVPFVFVYFMIRYRQNKWLPVICGILSGIAVSVSYDNLVPVIASVGFLAFSSQTFTNGLYKLFVFGTVFILAVLPHVITRFYFDPAFAPGMGGTLSIRDVSFGDMFSLAHLPHLATVWFTSLPGSFLLSSPKFLPAVLLCSMVCLFIFSGFFWYLRNKSVDKYLKIFPLAVIILFVTAYALGPFYGKRFHETNYVYYRHWCYIVPLLSMTMVNGFIHSGKWKNYVLTGWIVLCGIASIQYLRSATRIDRPAYRATGWILAKKYLDDPGKLFRVYALAEYTYRDELLVGYGWGLSAAVLRNRSDDAAVEKLVALIRQSPMEHQAALVNGVYYSFEKKITPVLDPQLLIKLRSRFLEPNKQ